MIEINDNPNLEVGIEDAVLKDELYRRVLADLVRRVDLRRRQVAAAGERRTRLHEPSPEPAALKSPEPAALESPEPAALEMIKVLCGTAATVHPFARSV